jgi:uncharacterized protein YkwD
MTKPTASKKTVRKIRTPAKKSSRSSSWRRGLKFVPALVLFVAAYGIQLTSASAGKALERSVLSYATSVSQNDLLVSTNSQRSANGVASLSLNAQLNSAAQAKANDMVARDYWSHTTPDGEQPWAFIGRAGYQYKAAGENLAYGFDTSADTVTGWMNSPPHRENLLKDIFVDVGFGIANSPNFVGSGEQTVVVAMYATPLSSAPTPTPAASSSPSQNTVAPNTKPAAAAPTPAPIEAEPIQSPIIEAEVPVPAAESAPVEQLEPAEAQLLSATPANVSRIQILTAGNAVWSRALLASAVGGVAILWLLQRGLHVRRFILAGEHLILNHLHIDLTVIGFLTLSWTLLQATGAVR